MLSSERQYIFSCAKMLFGLDVVDITDSLLGNRDLTGRGSFQSHENFKRVHFH